MGSADNHFLAFRIDETEFSDRAASLYVAYNGWAGDLNATFPPNLSGKRWYRCGDTADWMEPHGNFREDAAEELLTDAGDRLQERLVLILIEK